MLVFAAEFPTAKGRRAEEVLEVARKWVRGGRTYPWAEVGTDLREKPFDVAEYVHGSHTFALASTIDQENRTLAAVRQVATTEFEWITELAALEDDTALWISVSLTCNTLYPGSQPPHPKKPYLIGLLLRELGGGEDGPFRVSDGPHHLGHQDVKMAASLVFGTAATAL